jgi:chaperone modulatory protein CbpM
MIDFDALCRLVGGLEPRELEMWIAERWVLPERTGERYIFHDIDVARVRLIVELRREMAIDTEAMPLVLHLLDQVYASRRALRRVTAAIDALPPELREAVRQRLVANSGEE